jgi:hypothetical protein
MKRVKADDLHDEWMRKPSYRRAYEALEGEYALIAADAGALPRGLTREAPRLKTHRQQSRARKADG